MIQVPRTVHTELLKRNSVKNTIYASLFLFLLSGCALTPMELRTADRQDLIRLRREARKDRAQDSLFDLERQKESSRLKIKLAKLRFWFKNKPSLNKGRVSKKHSPTVTSFPRPIDLADRLNTAECKKYCKTMTANCMQECSATCYTNFGVLCLDVISAQALYDGPTRDNILAEAPTQEEPRLQVNFFGDGNLVQAGNLASDMTNDSSPREDGLEGIRSAIAQDLAKTERPVETFVTRALKAVPAVASAVVKLKGLDVIGDVLGMALEKAGGTFTSGSGDIGSTSHAEHSNNPVVIKTEVTDTLEAVK